MNENLFEVLRGFHLDAEPVSCEPYGCGHINVTYLVVTGSGHRYILQKINNNTFRDVAGLMENITAVTEFLRTETDDPRGVLTLVKTHDGASYLHAQDAYWRVYDFVEDSICLQLPETDEDFYQSAVGFGTFQQLLTDFPAAKLHETIPNFHNMEFRLRQFHEAVAANPAGRLEEVKDLVEEIEKRAEAMCIQERLYREGQLKKRTNHCDTKVNNMMFDADSDKVLCVIDLDTVMPGFVLSDIGDFIRTGANTGAEDDENLDNVNVNMEIFKAYTRGYMEKAKAFLTPTEIKLLPYGGRLLTYMQTVRFLTDYINGDTYYKIHSPKHNLIRTKAQFKLLQSLEAHAEEMDQFMNQWL